MVAQFDRYGAQPLNESPFHGPIRLWPAALMAAERERFARWRASRGGIPAHRVSAFLNARHAGQE